MSVQTADPTAATLEHFQRVRGFSELLCDPLEPEDCMLQSMPDASPIRWHLAHTTWFFETFVLKRAVAGYQAFDPAFEYLFNSYYNSVGQQYPRPQRGLISRPTVREVFQYRQHVDRQIAELLSNQVELNREADPAAVLSVLELGLHHEQQHQELMLTDLKHAFALNPLFPAYHQPRPLAAESARIAPEAVPELNWVSYQQGLNEIGHSGEQFCFDNERPRHRVYLHDYRLGSRLVTNAEFQQFIDDGGYQRPEFWLSEGWQAVQQNQWTAPLYWLPDTDHLQQFTLAGLQPVVPHEPVCHVSYFEADAYARWHGSRLPTEAEWEVAAAAVTPNGNFAEQQRFHPAVLTPDGDAESIQQLFGDVWEWTSSQYTAYPGYRTAEGALGEYNGKFMCNQFVLRGGSCVTSQSHMRATYRNFFPPSARWQFSGIRLAR